MNHKTVCRILSLWLIILAFCLLPFVASAELKIHFIDVGQGESILIQCDGESMLVDAGPEEAGKKVHDYISEKLDNAQLNYVLATHEHDDHLYGMPDALTGLTVKQIYSENSIPSSYWFGTVLPRLQGNELSVEKVTEGKSFKLGNAEITLFNPFPNATIVNDRCLVFRIDYGNNSALFTADLEGEGETYLLNSEAQLQADVLKVGHHGGNTSTSEQFLKTVNPKIAVISVGEGNKHGHPHKEIINRLEKYNVTVYRTDRFGTIVLTSDGTDWTVEVSKAR